MQEEPKATIFDTERYGALLRAERQKAGFKQAEHFCATVSDWTGVKVNKQVLYRIEKGAQPPTVEQLIAFSLVLNHGRGINNVLSKTELHHCITPYAEYLAAQNGPITSTVAYDGMFYEGEPLKGAYAAFRTASQDEHCANYLDPYYFDRLPQSSPSKEDSN